MSIFRILAIIFGIVFILIGILGYFPAFMQGDLLLGIFAVDSMHNLVHIASGVIALLAASKTWASILYFQLFGIVYGLVAILGFLGMETFMPMKINMADNVLHIVISLIALYIGFILSRRNRVYND